MKTRIVRGVAGIFIVTNLFLVIYWNQNWSSNQAFFMAE